MEEMPKLSRFTAAYRTTNATVRQALLSRSTRTVSSSQGRVFPFSQAE